MLTVFISRKLDSDSCFKQLNADKYQIIDFSLIDFETIEVTEVPKAEWYFFYSKNGVKHFYLNFGEDYFLKYSDLKIACMGYGTRNEFIKYYDHPVSFTGSGKPNQVAKSFSQKIENNDRLVFFTASDSLHSVGNLLSDKYHIDQLPIYHNQIKKDVKIPAADTLIFTSPKNVEAYFNTSIKETTVPVISIGQSTARKLHEHGVQEVIIATEPSESGMLKALKIISLQ